MRYHDQGVPIFPCYGQRFLSVDLKVPTLLQVTLSRIICQFVTKLHRNLCKFEEMDSLIEACRDLDHTPGLLNNDHARQFFTSFPLDSLFGSVFSRPIALTPHILSHLTWLTASFCHSCMDQCCRAFQSGVMQQMDLQTVIAVLSRLLETETGSSMLISAVPYLDAAVQSPVVPLRRLAAQQYSAMLILSQQSHPGSGSGSVPATSDRQLRHHAVSQLLAALQDKDTGIFLKR